jgi:nitrogen regulatory protein P-II 1
MKLVKAIIRPDKVEDVRLALEAAGVIGMTVSEVIGHGKQKGHTAIYRGAEYQAALLPKIEVEAVVDDSRVEDAVRAIIGAARTGVVGDGRVFVIPVEESYTIRTRFMER